MKFVFVHFRRMGAIANSMIEWKMKRPDEDIYCNIFFNHSFTYLFDINSCSGINKHFSNLQKKKNNTKRTYVSYCCMGVIDLISWKPLMLNKIYGIAICICFYFAHHNHLINHFYANICVKIAIHVFRYILVVIKNNNHFEPELILKRVISLFICCHFDSAFQLKIIVIIFFCISFKYVNIYFKWIKFCFHWINTFPVESEQIKMKWNIWKKKYIKWNKI